jgi:hypothetical protein
MIRRDQAAVAQDRGTLERIPQLAHVSRPVIFEQVLARVAGNP